MCIAAFTMSAFVSRYFSPESTTPKDCSLHTYSVLTVYNFHHFMQAPNTIKAQISPQTIENNMLLKQQYAINR